MDLYCYFASLGCDKNLVDSEKMMALLEGHEVIFTDEPEEAQIIIVNTCGFILDAKQESIETVIELAGYKKNGKAKALIVTGCLAERYKDEIRQEIPEVDAIVGTSGYDSIWDAVRGTLEGLKPDILKDRDYLPKDIIKRINTTNPAVRYLKIAEGCDKCCSYCAIPMMRGRYRSVPMEELIEETKLLAEAGAKELILVAQETTVYGVDLYGKKSLPELLKKLCKIDGIDWIRLMYCYPEEITDELLYTMKDEPKICHYLDLPIQHADDDVLKRMGRRTNRDELRQIISRIREIIPDIALRTTLISGFPGESEAQHESSLEFVKEICFDRLGVFPYSEEEGTRAAGFSDQIPVSERNDRADAIMRTSERIIFDKNESLVGTDMIVFVEGFLPEDGCYVGRSYRDAPDIDGYVFFEAEDELMTGDMVRVRITEAKGYDLLGEMK